MNIETAAILYKILKKLYKRDRANEYILPKDCDFLIHITTPDYNGKFWKFRPADGLPGMTHVTLLAYGRGVCDGASWAPDGPDGVKPAAAAHDPGYLELEAIARAWAGEDYAPGTMFERDFMARVGSKGSPYWTVADVRHLFDAIFGDAIAEVSSWPTLTRIYYSAVRTFGGICHTSGRLLPTASLLLLMSILSGCSGCQEVKDIADWPNGLPEPVKVAGETNSLISVIIDAMSESDSPTNASAASADEVAFASLEWEYGGFNGAGAVLDPAVVLADLKNSGTKVSYTWVGAAAPNGGLEAWGLGWSDAGAICAIFIKRSDGTWTGGKFDWVSTSRSFRGLEHLTNYNGWHDELPIKASVAFVVVSRDGKKRTNVIVAEGI